MSSHEVFKNEMMFDTEGKREEGIRIMYYPTEFYTARPAKLKLCREDSSLILVASNYPFMIRDEKKKWSQGPLTMFVNGDGSPTTIASSIRYWRFMDEEEAEQSYTELEKRFLNDEQRSRSVRLYHEIRRKFYG